MRHLKGKYLVVRADAGGDKGAGHLMRCLALGQAWQDAGGRVIFITSSQSKGLRQRLQKEGFGIHQLANVYPHNDDWDTTRSILADHPNAWVVLDGYHFDESYQKQVKDTGHMLLVIDDMAHLKQYYADILLNQNTHAECLSYSVETGTRLLLGTRYALLNKEFLVWKDWKRNFTEVAQRILVTLGGSDSNNNTLKVIEALQDVTVPGLEARVVIGTSNPHVITLKAAIRKSKLPVSLIYDAKNMPELMAWADIAVSAGGITVWELAFMGVPNIVIITAENQRLNSDYLEETGIALNLGWYSRLKYSDISRKLLPLLKDNEKREEMSQKGRKLVDGKGGQRVISIIAKG